jgi:hypothetical protein
MANDPSRVTGAIWTVANYLRLTIALALFAAIAWYLPYLALAAAVVIAVGATVEVLYKNFPKQVKRFPRLAMWWEWSLINIGRIFITLCCIALIIGVTGAIWIWYPFEPIDEIPIDELTLKQISGNLFGVSWLIVFPLLIASFARDLFRYELGDAAFYETGKTALLLAFVLIALAAVICWLAPAFIEQIVHKWQSDFYRWWHST